MSYIYNAWNKIVYCIHRFTWLLWLRASTFVYKRIRGLGLSKLKQSDYSKPHKV